MNIRCWFRGHDWEPEPTLIEKAQGINLPPCVPGYPMGFQKGWIHCRRPRCRTRQAVVRVIVANRRGKILTGGPWRRVVNRNIEEEADVSRQDRPTILGLRQPGQP